MKRVALAALVTVGAMAAALAQPPMALAHPLGNFTVNHYAGIDLAGDRVFVHFVLDLAEIPTLQSGDAVRAPGYAQAVARRLELQLDGARVQLETLRRRVTERPGSAGLATLRFEAVYAAPLHGRELTFSDQTFGSRIGWREITVGARDGARVLEASVPAESRSNALRAYPDELLSSPLDVRSASAAFEPGTASAPPPRFDELAPPVNESNGFEALIERDLSIGVLVISLLVAAFWGAVHALTPGHGKALVAGYLVGTKGRPRHAFLLGATVTVTHTAGVFALGLVTLALSQFVVPERLYPWLTLVSGLLVVAVGVGVLRSRFASGRHQVSDLSRKPDAHHHDHHHHDHNLTSRGIFGVGVAAGLLPCPSALVVLLSAIALHRVGFGLALIVAFSLGLATTVTGIGLVAVLARQAFARVRLDGPIVRALPAVSAAVVVVAGIVITARAVPGVI